MRKRVSVRKLRQREGERDQRHTEKTYECLEIERHTIRKTDIQIIERERE